MTSIMDESLFGGRTKSIEDIAKKFGVTMRQKKPPFSITRSSRYSKTQSMSFLESSTNPESQSRIIVREFKDPFCFSSSSQQENNNKASLVPSRNKWTSNDLTSYKRRSVNVDTNNNTNSRKHLSSNRNSSCTISFDELHGGRDEINTISEKDKPILKLWAQKNKSNAAVKDANRSSYLGSPNDAKKVLGQISGTPWGKYLKTNSRKDTMTESNKQDSRSTARRSDIMITTRSVRKGPQVETKVRPKSAYYEKTTIESLQKREIPIDIDDKNPMQNPSKDVNNNNNRTKALKRSSKIIIRSNSTAKEPPAPSVKTVIRTNSTATLDNKHVKVERKDSAERPKVNTTSDRADHKENVAISSSINNSKELLESEQAENTKHCRTASVDSSEPEQNQDIETREQSNTGNKPTPPKTLAKPKPPSSKKTVEYHNSFLDDLDDLESEIDQQLMGTNKQPPPPVPRRSSSKTSELTDFLKKLNDQEEKSSTPKLTRATTLTSPSTTTVITTATMTSTINSVITQNLSRTLPPTTTTTPSNEQEQKTTSNDNVEEKQSFKDTLAEYDVISSQSDEASENEAVKSNNIDPPNETYVDVEGKCVYAAPESTSLSEDRQLNKKESETNQRTDDNNSCHIINNVRNLFNDNTITKTHYDVNSFSTYIGKPEDEIINTTAQIDFVNNGGREQKSLADQKRSVSRTHSYDKKLRQLRTRSFSSADILLRRYNSVNDDPTTLYRSLTPEDERRKSVDFTRLVSATPWRNSKSSASPTDEKPSTPTGEKNFPTNEKTSVTNSKSILTAKETAAKVVLRSKSSNGIITTKEPLLNKHSRRRFSESFVYDNLLNHRQEVIPSTAFIIKQVDIDFESTANKTIDSVNTSELNLIKEETTINSYTDIESQITGLVFPPNQHQTHDNKDQVRNTRPLSFTRRKSSYTDVFYTTAELKEEDSELVLSAVPPTERRHIEIENESTTNFSSNFVNNEQPCRQPDAFEKKQQNHKQNVADVNGFGSSEDQSMSGRYYTTSTRSSNKYNSYYDRQHDPIFKTSSLSTNLSRRNNESANMSDKHFVGRKNSLDSQNDFPSSTHIKSRYERSYSLNEDYSSKYDRSYLPKVSRRASEDTSNIVDTSYVPKSAYLRQRLQEIQTSKDRGKQASRIRDNSLSSEGSSTSTPRRKTSLKTEDKIDEFIRNHRERRSTERRLSNSSSSSSYNSTSPPYSPVKTSSAKSSFTYISNNSKTSLTSSSRNNCLDNSSLEEEKEKVLNCKNSTTNHIQESNLLSNGHVRKDEYKSITPPPDTLKNFKSINPINTSYTEDQKNLEIKPIENQESKEHKEDEMRRGSLKDVKDAVVRRFAGSSDSKKIKEVQEEAPSDIQESPFDKNAITSKNEKDNKPPKAITVTTKTNRFGKEKTFGSITRITSSKISTATDLKSFSSSKKKDKQKHDAKTEDQTSPSKDENDTTTTSQDTQEPKQKFSRFSLKKKKSVDQTPALPSSPKQEPKQRKHSLTHVFSKHKKEKDDITSPTSPLSPNEDSPITSPTHNKERRGSAFSRLFSHKKHDQPEPSKEEKKTSKKTTSEKVKAPVEDVPKTPTKQPSPELDATSPNTSLSIPGANLNGSSESLYSDNDYGEPSTRRSSRNKERIRNRKLAKKEAAERHKSLPAGLEELQIDLEKGLAVPVSNNNTITGKESPSVTDATPRTRKKHRARRSNTEFLGNVPLISVEQASPLISKDDATVNRRNNRRNRRDRPKTLMNGLDSDVFNQGDENGGNEVVNENLSFSDIKKKLLEGLTDDKKIPEKVSSKERQKIKRTKSTKRYKTITEGIAPRDLELARQAIEAEKSKTDENGTSRNTIDKSTLDQITAALTSTGDKRKSFIVESRPASRYQSNEDLRISDDEDDKKSKDDSVIKPPATSRRMLQRTKSMTTLHLDTKAEVDADEPEIKPLSELKNRFLQAMEDTQQKHVNYKQSPVEVRRRARRDRKDRPHTICGIDQLTMGQLNDDKKEQEEKDNHRMEQIKNEINEVKQREEADRQARKEALTRPRRGSLEEKPKKREKKKYTRAQSEKIFNDIDDDLEDLLADGLNESDLADILGVNPSLAKDPFIPKAKKELDLEIKGNAEIKKAEEPVKPTKTELEPEEPVVNGTTNGEPLSDLDFVSSKSSQLSSSLANDKRKLRPNRKQRSGANPMKSLQNRDDLINEVAVADKQKEQRMNKIDLQSKFLRKNDLADEAISALRATVDFSKTKLRKVEVNKKTMADDVLDESFKPTEFENVLIQVKLK
uniref:Uncharacterized protein n=1 Tax=Clytia hemisphaerica TaxID=252671 RepID=A0A7M5UZ27_9CNID